MIDEMEKITIMIALLMGLTLILPGCNDIQEISVQETPIEEMTHEEVYQKMEQSNSEINKFNFDISLSYNMKKIFLNESIESKTQIDYIGYYDKIKEEALSKGKIINEFNGEKNISETETETKDGYITAKINEVVISKTEVEEGTWENVELPGPSLDPYYIPMGEDFEILSDETIDGIDCYVIIMYQEVEKIIESVLTPEGQTATTISPNREFPEGVGEVYVKLWLDKTDLHMVKSKSYLNIKSEKFSWLIDGEIIISNIS
jgi:hypothetical protein